ncbi:hypothetical protein BXT84_12275 [Sulfobacillus thermotolerans]|uniref:Methyltransferase type 11 domain-containing protein n=1 Tax=Sulfobacillus thermotolerans TaxID=338644 RepID=A0ABN5H5B4_9FIRM|nr:hypothetical protein BXT84_12275 [Sulfobacillus thermotolerans]
MTDPEFLQREYGSTEPLQVRMRMHALYSLHSSDVFDDLTQWARAKLVPQTILDVGMGSGHWYEAIVRHCPSSLYHGIDISEAMIESFSHYAPFTLSAHVSVADAMNVPFSNASMDWVGLHFMLYHVPDPHRALAEAWRVLKPGGLLMTLAHGSMNFSALTALHHRALAHCGWSARTTSEEGFTYTLDNGADYFPSEADVCCHAFPSGLRFPTANAVIAYYQSGFIFRSLNPDARKNDTLYHCLSETMWSFIQDHFTSHDHFDVVGRTGWLWAVKHDNR